MERPRCSALEKAMRLLTVSARTERELTQKLLRSDYGPTETAAAVEECRKRGYINDELYASDFTVSGMDRGTGPRLLRQKLLRRGIPRELALQTLEQHGDLEESGARRALEFKWRMLSREQDPYKKKMKAFRFLAGRGFSPELAARLVREMAERDKQETENEPMEMPL